MKDTNKQVGERVFGQESIFIQDMQETETRRVSNHTQQIGNMSCAGYPTDIKAFAIIPCRRER